MNDLFRAIESSSIPISDFELTQITLPFDMTSKDERMRYSWPVTTIYHLNTSSIFAIAQFYGERFRLRSQWGYRGSENEFFGEWPSEPGTHQSWETVLFLFNVWKNCVEIILTQRAAERKRKEDLEGVTDLWEELKRGRRLPAEDHEQDIENTPFSSAEQAEIALRIGQAKDYIRTSSALTSDQIARVEARFEHAEEASRRIGRKDWLMLFNGAVISLILTDLITPSTAQHIIMLTLHGLGHLFGFGGPPHLPLGG